MELLKCKVQWSRVACILQRRVRVGTKKIKKTCSTYTYKMVGVDSDVYIYIYSQLPLCDTKVASTRVINLATLSRSTLND